MQRAEQAVRAQWLQSTQRDAASWFDLYSLYFTAPLVVVSSWRLHLKKQASAVDNVKRWGYTESYYSFSGNSFRCYPASVCFFQTSIKDKKHRFGKCCTEKEGTEVNVTLDTQDVNLKHSAMILFCSTGGSGIKHKAFAWWKRPTLFRVTQRIRHLRRTFVPVEPSYYQLSSCLPPVLRLMICTVLHQYVFTMRLSYRPMILLSSSLHLLHCSFSCNN